MMLERLGGILAEAASEAVETACREVCDTARALCPVDSGQLRQSLSASGGDAGAGATGTVSAGAFYAGMVELGTYKQAPQPFLEPAFLRVKGGVVADVAKRIRAAL